jgi:hypothetical protein
MDLASEALGRPRELLAVVARGQSCPPEAPPQLIGAGGAGHRGASRCVLEVSPDERTTMKRDATKRAARLRTIRVMAICTGLASAILFAGPASASTPIGPNQHFVGLVNGKHKGAVIYTVCPGPAGGTRYGPPAGGQTVAVKRVTAGGGDTGSTGHLIYARITPTTIVTLTAYGQPEPIPTTASVPCDGPGIVLFTSCPVPQPCGAGAKANNVAVTFINIAV